MKASTDTIIMFVVTIILFLLVVWAIFAGGGFGILEPAKTIGTKTGAEIVSNIPSIFA